MVAAHLFAGAELSLEQSGRTARPDFALRFGDALDVVDVGSGLRQDMVQIIADADEGEALVEKLSDTSGAEQE